MRNHLKTKIPLVLFLHFYQPPNQQTDILQKIVFESYRPIFEIFLENPAARATFSFPAGLIELLEEKGYGNLIYQLRKLMERGQIELTGTAAYHAFLPLIPIAEIKRQILQNEQILNRFLGKAYPRRGQDGTAYAHRGGDGTSHKRMGFFPPELAFSYKVAKIVAELGFSWMAIPMISQGPEIPDFTTLYKLNGYNLYLFPRHKWASSVILSGVVRSKKSFSEWLGNTRPGEYILTIMDGETFGHHRPGLEELLKELCKASEFELLQVSDLLTRIEKVRQIKPREASWSNEEQDFWLDRERKKFGKNPFLLWCDPANPIHKLQWRLTNLAIRSVKNYELKFMKQPSGSHKRWLKARKMLDQALASDQYWWASAKPWWSLEMIEAGAWQQVKVVKTSTGTASKLTKQAESLYRKILDQAFLWQRTGYIRKMHQTASTTVNMPSFAKRAPAEWYNQIILEFEDEMAKAAANLEFEKAVKWRDAIYKLSSGADVFDILHVVDELAGVRKIPSLKPFLLHKDSEISKFARKYLKKLSKQEIETGKENLRKQGLRV